MNLVQRSTENEKPHQREETPVDPDFYRVIFIQNKNNNTWKKVKIETHFQIREEQRYFFLDFLFRIFVYI